MVQIELDIDKEFYVVKTKSGEKEEGLGLTEVPKDELVEWLTRTEKEK